MCVCVCVLVLISHFIRVCVCVQCNVKILQPFFEFIKVTHFYNNCNFVIRFLYQLPVLISEGTSTKGTYARHMHSQVQTCIWPSLLCLQCFDAVGWVTGRASDL